MGPKGPTAMINDLLRYAYGPVYSRITTVALKQHEWELSGDR
jgi:hypothetical protein